MADTSSRTLRLLSLLQTHRYWTGEELADRLDVSVRTLRRDVDRLRELGYPVQADRGVGGGYQLAPGASLPPLVLDDEEAVALAVGLRAATHGALTGIAEASVRALAKVTQVMPRALRGRVEALDATTVAPPWGASPEADPETLVLLAQACRDDERVGFGYRAVDGAETSRRVEPAHLVQVGRRWYLVGYDLDRGDWRSFRLDRITRPERSGRRFAARQVPGGDPAAFVQQGLHRAPNLLTLTVVLTGAADAVRDRIGQWAEVTPIDGPPPDRSSAEPAELCRVELNAASLEWAAFAIGISGGRVIACDSAALRALLEDWADRFTRPAAVAV